MLSGRDFLKLRGRVQELAENLPRKVELINLDAAPDWFLDSINYSPIFLGGNHDIYSYMRGVIDGVRRQQTKKVA